MMFDDDELAINDSEDNMIIIHGIKPAELMYTLRNICCAREGLKLKDCNKQILLELKTFFTNLDLDSEYGF